MSTPSRTSARVGLALAVVLSCGALAPAASASGSTTTSAHNGPIAFDDGVGNGTGWVEVNPDGSDSGGRHLVTPSGSGFTAGAPVGQAAFSRDGSKVAFVQESDSSLWAANADGSGAKRLTTPANGAQDVAPAWSADGSAVYFTRFPAPAAPGGTPGSPQFMQVPAAGGTAAAVLATPDAGGDGFGVESPDGGKLAYEAVDATGRYVVIADAKTHARISAIPNAFWPRFSLDGKSLAVITGDASSGGLFLYPAAGPATAGAPGQQVVAGDLNGLALGGYAFSPDGTQVAYEDMDKLGNTEILTKPLAGGAVVHTGVTEPVFDGMDWQNGPLYTGPVTPAPPRPKRVPAAIRLAGADRIGTAVAVAEAGYGGTTGYPQAASAVISRADSFADALAGNALAAQKHGPLLLTDSGRLDPRVAAELAKTVAPHGTVYILGGEQALSTQVWADVAALGFNPVRLAGPDRFSTAVAIAHAISPNPHRVMVATGANFPDALAAGAAAASDPLGGVVVLTDGATVPAATAQYLGGVNPATTAVYAVGGAAVQATNSVSWLAGRFTGLAGGDRFGTAAAVGGDKSLFPAPSFAGLATGANWPDALSGGALVGSLQSPLLLTDTDTVPAPELSWLHANGPQLVALPVFGGVAAVPQAVVLQAGDAAWGAGNWDPYRGISTAARIRAALAIRR